MVTQYPEADELFEKSPALLEQTLEEQLKKNPKDVQAWLILGTTRLKLDKYEQAAEAFRDALRVEVNNREAQVLLATALQFANDLPNALAAWQAVAKADPTSIDAQSHVAMLAEATGQSDVSLGARRELVKLQPDRPETMANLAVYLSRTKQHAEAVRLFERANTLEPGFLDKNPIEAEAYKESKQAAKLR